MSRPRLSINAPSAEGACRSDTLDACAHASLQCDLIDLDRAFEYWIVLSRALEKITYDRDVLELDSDERKHYLTQMLLGLSSEVIELSQEVNWKDWRNRSEAHDKICDEAADVLIFFFNVMATLGVTGVDLTDAIHAKRAKNHARDKAQGRI